MVYGWVASKKDDVKDSMSMLNMPDLSQNLGNLRRWNLMGKVRVAVVNRLMDEQFALDSFKDDPDFNVREAVVNKLTDEQLIFDTFKFDCDWVIRFAVVNKLTDKRLIRFFENDSSSVVRNIVQLKLAK